MILISSRGVLALGDVKDLAEQAGAREAGHHKLRHRGVSRALPSPGRASLFSSSTSDSTAV